MSRALAFWLFLNILFAIPIKITLRYLN